MWQIAPSGTRLSHKTRPCAHVLLGHSQQELSGAVGLNWNPTWSTQLRGLLQNSADELEHQRYLNSHSLGTIVPIGEGGLACSVMMYDNIWRVIRGWKQPLYTNTFFSHFWLILHFGRYVFGSCAEITSYKLNAIVFVHFYGNHM